MKSKDDETTAGSNGRSTTATAVEEAPSATPRKRGLRLPRANLDKELAEQLVAQAREDGVDLVGLDGLLRGSSGSFWRRRSRSR